MTTPKRLPPEPTYTAARPSPVPPRSHWRLALPLLALPLVYYFFGRDLNIWAYKQAPDIIPAPTSPMDANVRDRRAAYMDRFEKAKKGPNGLPLVDVDPIFPSQAGKVPPNGTIASRVTGNRLLVRRITDGDTLYYDVADKPMLLIETAKTFVAYSVGDDQTRVPLPAKVNGFYQLPITILPAEFLSGPPAHRHTQIWLIPAAGKDIGGFRLSLESSLEIAAFKKVR